MKYRDWNEMQRKLEALYVLDNALTDPSEEHLRLIRKIEDGERRCYILIYRFLFWDIAYKVSRLWK